MNNRVLSTATLARRLGDEVLSGGEAAVSAHAVRLRREAAGTAGATGGNAAVVHAQRRPGRGVASGAVSSAMNMSSNSTASAATASQPSPSPAPLQQCRHHHHQHQRPRANLWRAHWWVLFDDQLTRTKCELEPRLRVVSNPMNWCTC